MSFLFHSKRTENRTNAQREKEEIGAQHILLDIAGREEVMVETVEMLEHQVKTIKRTDTR